MNYRGIRRLSLKHSIIIVNMLIKTKYMANKVHISFIYMLLSCIDYALLLCMFGTVKR